MNYEKEVIRKEIIKIVENTENIGKLKFLLSVIKSYLKSRSI